MMIDEIINRIFQQNILELKFSAFSDAFFKRTTRASPFPCVFHQTMIKEQVTILQLHMQIQNYFLENSFFLFVRIIVDEIHKGKERPLLFS